MLNLLITGKSGRMGQALLEAAAANATVTVTATSREQLDELYRTLSTHPMVKVVL